MNKNSLKLLSFLIIFIGTSILLFGLIKQPEDLLQSSVSLPQVQNNATLPASFGIEGQHAKVTKVIDGDTVEIASGAIIRYLGIDTPETVDPRRPVQCFGKEASRENKRLVEGKEVILQKDISEKDKYDRLLRYVFLPLNDGNFLFVNDYLIRQGFAMVLSLPPDVKYSEQFLEAQGFARLNKKGLWGRC